MEYTSSSAEKGINCGPSPREQLDPMVTSDGGLRNLMSEELLNTFSEPMNLDWYAGWCSSPSSVEQMLSTYGVLGFQSIIPCPSLDTLSFAEQNSSTFPDSTSGKSGYEDRGSLPHTNGRFNLPLDNKDDLTAKHCYGSPQSKLPDAASSIVSRPVSMSLDEKMLKALSLLKGPAAAGILAQVWVPIKHGDQYMLSTSEQPYLLDQSLAGYREVSRTFAFSAERKAGLSLGLPGRVFVSKIPEWTSNVIYYKNAEYLRVDHAINHAVRGSAALPIFDPFNMSCCAVLELVTVKEKADFDSEMDNVCHALKAVNLRSTGPPRLLPQGLSRNQKLALADIADVLRVVCHAHRLPLALTWIPCEYTEEAGDDIINVRVREGNLSLTGKCILCIEGTACYINDKEMQGFVHACMEHHIMEGQGIAGKALQSNHPFFSADVKAYDITEYPLVHHARKYGLNAAVAIRLRSTHTGDDDYILEFFLPINLKGSTEQQLLLNNLSGTMQRICKSLRTVADAELVGDEGSKLGCQGEAVPTPKPMSLARETAQIALPEGNFDSTDKTPFNISSSRTYDAESMGPHDQVATASRRQPEKKRSTAEKNVSLSVLQQYFSGSLKDAAKSIGVCPTTLKRICRQHGISRWPSRKINKVNRSLRKIQTVLDSVQGVEGGLKFNPITGGFVAGGSVIHDVDSFTGSTLQNGNLPVKNSYPVNRDVKSVPLAPYSDSDSFTVKLDGHGDDNCIQTSGEALRKSNISVVNWNGGSKLVGSDDGLYQQANFEYRPWSCVNTSSILTAEMDAKLEGDDAITEHNQPTCSSTTDSSNGSDSFIHSSSSSPCMKEEKHSKVKASVGDTGTKITVKATYKEDTVRFKFEPSSGCLQLYEEVGKRFNLQDGTFQLKYLDDEEEWVMLTSDSDLLECVELMECVGTRNAKLLVRDTLLTMGSSGSSNCFLAGSS